jgi:hypothetical protein
MNLLAVYTRRRTPSLVRLKHKNNFVTTTTSERASANCLALVDRALVQGSGVRKAICRS